MIRLLLMGAMLLITAACASKPSAYTPMSDREYLSASPEERNADDQKVEAMASLIDRKERMLRAYLPVPFESEGTGFTLLCIWQPGQYNMLEIYSGHSAPGYDRANVQAIAKVMANKDCEVLYREKDGAVMPMMLQNEIVAQEDFGRAMFRSVVPAFVNGTGAALINNLNRCDENCGTSIAVQGGSALANAGAQSDSRTDTNVNVNSGTCGNGGECNPPEM